MSINYEEKAKQLRRDIVTMVYNMKSGHIGGSLSMVEILVSLYFKYLNIDAKNPLWEDRDRLVLSKGHTAPGLYAVLADKGFFPKEYLMNSFRKINSKLQGHPDLNKTPGVDMTAGSLGMGLSAANGMAMSARLQNKSYRCYVIIGDGEANEGQIWEAAATAAHYKLDNLTAFIDINKLQNDGDTKDIKDMGSMKDKWEAFGWNTVEVDGHSFDELFSAIETAISTKGKPTAIICHTVKGKGVSFMENQIKFHGSSPDEEQYKLAIKELS